MIDCRCRNVLRFVNVRFTVEDGASLVFDLDIKIFSIFSSSCLPRVCYDDGDLLVFQIVAWGQNPATPLALSTLHTERICRV